MTLHPSMLEATKLTRSGKLGEAANLLRSILAGAHPGTSAGREAHTGATIDLKPESVRVSSRSSKAPSPAAPRTSTGAAEFKEHVHSSAHGRLAYKLYIPPRFRPGGPLIVMLHGCTQTPDDFAIGTGMNQLADEHGIVIAYPAQSRSANISKCWNWFKPGDQQRESGEPALIAGLTRDVIEGYGIDPRRVYVAGLSAGGAAAAVMGETYPDLYAAVGVHSGLPCGAARDLSSAMTAMREGASPRVTPLRAFVPTISFHGDADSTVNKINAERVVAQAAASNEHPLRRQTSSGKTAGGRTYSRSVSFDLSGVPRIEQWTVNGGGHAWFGGNARGSYTDPKGPDASREMVRFFFAQNADK